MKKLTRVICVMMFCLVAIMGMSNVSNAATVDESLTSPDNGWQRYDDSNNLINFSEIGVKHVNDTSSSLNYYNGTITGVDSGSKAALKFKGTGIRIIGVKVPLSEVTKNVTCVIDGIIYTYNNYGTTRIAQCLLLNVTGLNSGIHTVEIYTNNTGCYFNLDAIDIQDGCLVDYYQPTNLKANACDSQVNLTWDVVEGATGYNIKRSTIAGGPYEYVRTSQTNSYIDKNVINETTYYYVVSATVDGKESSNSVEVSATTKVVFLGNNAILEIVMTNGTIKEYNLTATELEAFLTWYDNRSDGVGKSYYRIPKKSNVKPFLTRKEYLSFDKIYSFEVKDYNE